MAGLLMLDVQDMRLCHAPPECEYVALSYRWPKRTFTLTRSTMASLSAPGALHIFKPDFPRVFQDAIDCVVELKRRFLWIDALCIIQDDEAHKNDQIPRMDRIYGSAMLTMVACHRTNEDNVGLRGYRSGTRATRQRFENVKGLNLVVPFREYPASGGRPWASRAWTYQEEVLSRRKLFFTDYQLYFVCACAVFCEDTISEERTTSANIVQNSGLAHPGPVFQRLSQGPQTDLRDYMSSVSQYSARTMTDPADVIFAFQGMLSVFGRRLKSSFLAGLPERYLDATLLWGVSSQYKLRDSSVKFPTWSWAGWDTEILYHPDIGHIVVSEVKWYIEDFKGFLYNIENEIALEARSIHGVNGNKVVRPTVGLPDSLQFVKPRQEYVVQDMAWGRSQYLLCWTCVASFSIPGAEVERPFCVANGHEKRLEITDALGRFAGSILMHTDLISTMSGTGSSCEFMLLSRSKTCIAWEEETLSFDGSVFPEREWCFINVLLIERNDTTARRVGIATIHEDAWVEANPTAMLIRLE